MAVRCLVGSCMQRLWGEVGYMGTKLIVYLSDATLCWQAMKKLWQPCNGNYIQLSCCQCVDSTRRTRSVICLMTTRLPPTQRNAVPMPECKPAITPSSRCTPPKRLKLAQIYGERAYAPRTHVKTWQFETFSRWAISLTTDPGSTLALAIKLAATNTKHKAVQ